MTRKPPRKSRCWIAPRIGGYQAVATDQPKPEELPPGPGSASHADSYSAPSHMGGQFDEAGHHSGYGVFGFTQHTA